MPPLREGNNSSAEGGVRVPMIARWPGRIPAKTECDELAAGFDFLPTFAALAEAPLPENLRPNDRRIDGKNILPLLTDDGAKTPHDRFYYFADYRLEGVRRGPASSALVVHDSIAPHSQQQQGVSLYNLDDDVSESKNLAAEHPEKVAELKQLLKECRADLGD